MPDDAKAIRQWTIYALVDPRDQAIRYVGCTHCGRARFLSHLNDARRGLKGRRNEWIRELLALKLEPQQIVIEAGSGPDWESAERRWIGHFREAGTDLTNIADGGQGKPGFRPAASTIALRVAKRTGQKDSPEAKARKSAARIGMKFSDEHRANMSAVRLGKKRGPSRLPRTAEMREAASQRLTGRKAWPNGRTFSPEWRAKMAAAKLGTKRVFSEEHRRHLSEALRRRSASAGK